jgi:hypothetical protein
MSTKKEPLKIDASDYLNTSFVRSLIFEHPETLIDELNLIKNPLESVLSAFELIAKNILENKPESESRKFAAEQVLTQAKKIRKAKDPETAAIAMMILSFSLSHAEASGMLFEGARFKVGQKNKKAFRGLLGVLGAISHFLNKDETLTAKQLWDWRFKKLVEHENPDLDRRLRLFDENTGSEFEIYFYENRIYQREFKNTGTQSERSIGWESFRKTYVPMVQKIVKK